jgi:hypothetical protein
MIRSFDGNGDVDIGTWFAKLKLVAKLKKIEDLSLLIPLYLDGAAFAVYDQMDEEAKKKADDIEKVMLGAFAQDAFGAYDVFRQRSWCPGEPVDVFLSDLRRLARLAGVESEELIRCAFVCGLPSDVSSTLRAGVQINATDLSAIAQQARILMSERLHGGAMAAIGKTNEWLQSGAVGNDNKQLHGGVNAAVDKANKHPNGKMKCYVCGGDHPVRLCKERKPPTCWTCGVTGHISRYCSPIVSEHNQGKRSENGQGKLPAPAVLPTM